MAERAPRVLLSCGYFDWFSGYQEVGLARALAPLVDTHVLAGDRVNPLFSDEHLSRIGHERTYPAGTALEEGVSVTRVACREFRSMLWSPAATEVVARGEFDLVIQVMPGQLLPAAASLAGRGTRRSVLYGDNIAMYAALSGVIARAKHLAFAASKGSLYRFVNGRATHVYGYTPNTLARLARFNHGHEMRLLPLAFDASTFALDDTLRRQWRLQHGYEDDEVVILAAGKVQPQKRIDALVRAFAQLRAADPGVRLHLIGVDDSPGALAVRAAVSAMGGESVRLEGFVEAARLNAAFNGADLGVWPAMPAITIQQAMGTGLPVLVPDNDLVRHLIGDPDAGAAFGAVEPLETSLGSALEGMVDRFRQYGDPGAARRARASGNRWLSTPALAHRLLRDAGIEASTA